MGIEPTLEAWEAPVLPLNYTREIVFVGLTISILASHKKGGHLAAS